MVVDSVRGIDVAADRGSEPIASIRIDRWLWATRLFKTRALAVEACRGGRVTVGGDAAKPARTVRVGDRIEVGGGDLVRTYRVAGLIGKRVGANRLDAFLAELTSPDELERARKRAEQRRLNDVFEGAAGGRPTKRDRRRWETFVKAIK